jgi:hypothetical protein
VSVGPWRLRSSREMMRYVAPVTVLGPLH